MRRGEAVLAEGRALPQHQMAVHAVALRRMVQTKLLGGWAQGLLPGTESSSGDNAFSIWSDRQKSRISSRKFASALSLGQWYAVPELARVAVHTRRAASGNSLQSIWDLGVVLFIHVGTRRSKMGASISASAARKAAVFDGMIVPAFVSKSIT